MKVFVNKVTDELLPLEQHLKLEGIELVNNEEKSQLVICESNALIHDNRFIYSHVKFPHAVLQLLGLDIVFSKTKYFVSKWYDYEKGWGKQTFLGIPVHGMMNGNLGDPMCTATCGRYIKSDQVPDIFLSAKLKSFLNDFACRGFVTVEFSASHEVTVIRTGVPYNGLYNLLEGAKGSLIEFLLDPFENRLLESWTTCLLFTRCPFPYAEAADKISIHHVTPEVEAHVWFYEISRFRRSLVSTESKVGLITAWGETLVESNRRALRTASGLDVPKKQYRLDAARQAGIVYSDLLSSNTF